MSNESVKLPQSTFVVTMKHKYNEGDKVKCVNNRNGNTLRGQYGIITEKMPFTFVYPAYRVRFGDKIVAMSEVSLRKVRLLDRMLLFLMQLGDIQE